MPNVWTVIPAHNESPNIYQLVKACQPYGYVLVVDDGSTDDTAFVAQKAGALVRRNPKGSQYGDGIRLGLTTALEEGTERIVTMNAGNTHNPSDILSLLAALDEGDCDVVLGSKVVKGAKRIQPWPRWILTWCAARYLGHLTGLGVLDYSSFRAFTREGAARALSLMDGLDMRCYALCPPWLFRMWAAGLRIKQVPITYEAKNSTLDWGQACSALFQLWADAKAVEIERKVSCLK